MESLGDYQMSSQIEDHLSWISEYTQEFTREGKKVKKEQFKQQLDIWEYILRK